MEENQKQDIIAEFNLAQEEEEEEIEEQQIEEEEQEEEGVETKGKMEESKSSFYEETTRGATQMDPSIYPIPKIGWPVGTVGYKKKGKELAEAIVSKGGAQEVKL